MGPFVLAWLFGEGLIAWRSVSQDKMPPSPRALLLASGLFAGLGVLAEYAPARNVAAGFAWAVNLAVLMKALPGSGDPAAIKKGTTSGWASIGMAGNTVIIPDGTIASTSVADPVAATSASSAGTGTGTGSSGSVNTSVLGVTGNNTAAANQGIAKQVMAANPQFASWSAGQQWDCLVKLWNQESGWSTTAHNASGATGIPQSLHGTPGGPGIGGNEFNASDAEGLSAQQLAAANAGNAAAQIAWGLAYIHSRYGSPCAAWAHEQSNNWY